MGAPQKGFRHMARVHGNFESYWLATMLQSFLFLPLSKVFKDIMENFRMLKVFPNWAGKEMEYGFPVRFVEIRHIFLFPKLTHTWLLWRIMNQRTVCHLYFKCMQSVLCNPQVTFIFIPTVSLILLRSFGSCSWNVSLVPNTSYFEVE
jgi:hypothetical protein